MSNEILQQLFYRWSLARDDGNEVPVEEICKEHPEYQEDLRQRIDQERALLEIWDAPSTQAAAKWIVGESCLGYQLIKRLGEGGFGEVWEAVDSRGKRVALKRITKRRQIALERNAIETVQNLRHPHLLSVKVLSDSEEELLLEMELCDQNLLGLLSDYKHQGHQGIPVEELLRHMEHAAQAIDFLNVESNVQHRDIKPANLFLQGGSLKVGDFGLAKIVAHDDASHTGVQTERYAPPEYFRGSVSPRSDQYSLALTYLDLRLGDCKAKPSLSRLPPAEAGIVKRALNADPAARWASCSQFVERLRQCGDVPDGLAQGASSSDRQRDGQDFRASQLDLPCPIEFTSFLQEKCKSITGRKWLFNEVETWANRKNETGLLIVGSFGTGKSSFLAELIRRNKGKRIIAHHCIQWDVPETRRSAAFVRSLAGMLGAHLKGFERVLRNTPDALQALTPSSCERDPLLAFDIGVLGPLNKLDWQASDIRFIVIDALDEADVDSKVTIPRLLASRVKRLPPWLRIIASTRPDHVTRDVLSGIRKLVVDRSNTDHADDVRDDLLRFINQRLTHPDLQGLLQHANWPAQDFAQTLLEKSETNFLYVSMAFDGLKNGIYGMDQIDQIPTGLQPLYAAFFKRRWPTQKGFTEVRPVLEVLVAAQQPPSEELLAAATGLDQYQLDVQLDSIAHYIDRRQGTVQLRHRSIMDWLIETRSVYRVIPLEGHKKLAIACATEYDALRSGNTEFSGYWFTYLPHHLIETKNWQGLVNLFCDLSFMEARLVAAQIRPTVQEMLRAVTVLPLGHTDREVLTSMANDLHDNAGFLTRHPSCLFQTIWNNHYLQEEDGFKNLLKRWRSAFESREPRMPWVRLMCKNAPLGGPRRLAGAPAPACRIVASAAANRIAALSEDGTLTVWCNGNVVAPYVMKDNDLLVPLAFDDRGSHLLAAGFRRIVVLRISTSGVVSETASWPCSARPIAASPMGNGAPTKVLMSDGNLLIWNGADSTPEYQRVAKDVEIEAGAVSQSGTFWLAITSQGRLIGDTATGIIDMEMPVDLCQYWTSIAQDRFFTRRERFKTGVSSGVLDHLRSLLEPLVSLQATSGWIAYPTLIDIDVDNAVYAPALWHPNCVETVFVPSESSSLAFADGKPLLAFGTSEGRVNVCNFDEERFVCQPPVIVGRGASPSLIDALLWAENDAVLFASASDRENYAQYGTLSETREFVPFEHENDSVYDDDHGLYILTPGHPRVPTFESPTVVGICCLSDEMRFATRDEAGDVSVWEAETGNLLEKSAWSENEWISAQAGASKRDTRVPRWRGRDVPDSGNDTEPTVTHFDLPGHDLVAFYPTPLEGLVRQPNGNIFCGCSDSEVHIIRIENCGE